jgi:transposase-like protein
MAKKRFSPEQIITMLREAEVLLNQSNPVAEVCRKLGISEQTYYRWRKEYGGMQVDQARRSPRFPICPYMTPQKRFLSSRSAKSGASGEPAKDRTLLPWTQGLAGPNTLNEDLESPL